MFNESMQHNENLSENRNSNNIQFPFKEYMKYELYDT